MQNSLKRTCLFLFTCFHIVCSLAQESADYELLWQIEGNGLSKPSYLFGTMHVKDARAFNFSDSVMTSIEKCGIFALEVHPDSLIRAMFDRKREKPASSKIEDLLSEEQMNLLKERFKEINGYNYDELANKNTAVLKRLLQPKMSKENDKETFVDAYLYGIAKTMGKRLVGLEEIGTQLDLIEGKSVEDQREMILSLIEMNQEEFDAYMDDFVGMYEGGNLENLQSNLNGHALADPVMVERNAVMADRIDLFMSQEPTFAAVGAAHLPGEQGVISLLRKKGYTVEAVNATFTGLADNYKIDLMQMKWPRYQDDALGFSVEMPGIPFPDDRFDPMQMFLYPDLATGAFYSMFIIDMRTLKQQISEEDLLDNLVKKFKSKEGQELLSPKKFKRGDIEGLEGTVKTDKKMALKFQMLVKDKIFYCMLAGKESSKIEKPYLKRFFESLQLFEAEAPREKTWLTHKDDTAAFSISIPAKAEVRYNVFENPADPDGEQFKVKLYLSNDKSNQTNYIFGYNDFPRGYYLENRGEGLNALVEEIQSNGELVSPADTIWKDGYEGRELKLKLGENTYIIGRLYARGNRIYRIFKQSFSRNEVPDFDDRYFDSFRIEPFEKGQLKTVIEYEDLPVKFSLFGGHITELDSSTDYSSTYRNYVAFQDRNPFTGGAYLFEYYELDPYFRVDSLSAYYDFYKGDIMDYGDTLLSETDVNIGPYRGKELLIQDTLSHENFRLRFWLENRNLYCASVYGELEEIQAEVAEKFLSSISYIKEPVPFDYLASKSKDIIEALSSSDTAEYNRALGAFEYYEFLDEDIPLIEESLKLSYPDDSLETGARGQLIEEVFYLESDDAIAKLKELYQQENLPYVLKNKILSSLLDHEHPESLQDFLSLFLNNPPKEVDNAWKYLEPFYDSLGLAFEYYDKLLPMMEISDMKSSMLYLSKGMLNSGDEDLEKQVRENYSYLIKYREADLERYWDKLQDTTSNSYMAEILYYLQIMRSMPSDKQGDVFSNRLLNPLVPEYYQSEAVRSRISLRQATDKEWIRRFLESEDYQYVILEAYSEAGKLKEVPKKYRNAEQMAYINLRYVLCEDESCPEELRKLGKITDGDKSMYAFAIVYSSSDGTKYEYLGLSGPFEGDPAKTDVKNLPAFCDWDILEEDWEAQAKALWQTKKE
ncbi:MAG: TraB/GumN family protein [Bacteroidia bacterium]|nr:TraB/GumN family protein [Bacteroidia bacterium]